MVHTSLGGFATQTNPTSIAITPDGQFLYVANPGSDTVSIFTINTSTGALSSGGAIATDSLSVGLTVDPSGRFVYAANIKENLLKNRK